jgi:hypothetical protein
MYQRNRCLDEMTEILQRGLRDAVQANSSHASGSEARQRADWLRRLALALAAGLSALALSVPFWG